MRKVLERLKELKEKAKGTIFAEFVDTEVEGYKKQLEKELKKTTINNKWIDQADQLFNLFNTITEEYRPQIEPFASSVEFVDRREDNGVVMLTATNYKNETYSLQCADLHSLRDYQKLEDDEFVETLDEESEEGGVEFFIDRETAHKVKHSDIFKNDEPLRTLQTALEPFILELFKKLFDIETLIQRELPTDINESIPAKEQQSK